MNFLRLKVVIVSYIVSIPKMLLENIICWMTESQHGNIITIYSHILSSFRDQYLNT